MPPESLENNLETRVKNIALLHEFNLCIGHTIYLNNLFLDEYDQRLDQNSKTKLSDCIDDLLGLQVRLQSLIERFKNYKTLLEGSEVKIDFFDLRTRKLINKSFSIYDPDDIHIAENSNVDSLNQLVNDTSKDVLLKIKALNPEIAPSFKKNYEELNRKFYNSLGEVFIRIRATNSVLEMRKKVTLNDDVLNHINKSLYFKFLAETIKIQKEFQKGTLSEALNVLQQHATKIALLEKASIALKSSALKKRERSEGASELGASASNAANTKPAKRQKILR